MPYKIRQPGCERWEIPAITGEQMALIDEIMVNHVGVGLVQMMELTGRNLAHFARARFLGGDPRGKRVVVLAGAGGNGGGGLVAARRLHAWCAQVEVWLSKPAAAYSGVPEHQLHALQRLGVSIHGPDAMIALGPSDLLVDALVGYRLNGDPCGVTAALIRSANATVVPILSLDLPSGLDATTGRISNPCIRATATLTLALPKIGLWKPGAHDVTGELYLADIAIPYAVYTILGIEPGPIFAKEDLLRIG